MAESGSGKDKAIEAQNDKVGDWFDIKLSDGREVHENQGVFTIEGMYYTWDRTDDITLANWGGGEMKGTYSRAVGEETADLITWYDVEIGISYSLSTVTDDLDGFDLQAIAESMYSEENEPTADMP